MMEVTFSFLYQESEKEEIIRFVRGSVFGTYYNSIVKLENTLNKEIIVFTKFSCSEEELEKEVDSHYKELKTEYTLYGKDEYFALLLNNFDIYLMNYGFDELVRRYLINHEIDHYSEDGITFLLTRSYKYMKNDLKNMHYRSFIYSKSIIVGSNRSLKVSVGKLIGSNLKKPVWLWDAQQISGIFIADRRFYRLHFIVHVGEESIPLREPHLSLPVRLQKNGTKRISVGEFFSDRLIFSYKLLDKHIKGKFMVNDEYMFIKFDLKS